MMPSIVRSAVGLFLFILLNLSSGCAHSLTVTNLDKYQSFTANSLKKPMSVGIVPVGQSDHRLISGIAKQLGSCQASVIMPYTASGKSADVVAAIGIDSKYEGSGWNFLINFPGFLVFAPAWHGYNYEVTHAINVQLTRGIDNEQIDSFTLPVALDIRHADINRTWTEVSWFEWGVIAFVGGIVFVDYDDNVTPLLAEKVSVPLGNYVAQEIVNRVNRYGGLNNMGENVKSKVSSVSSTPLGDRLKELKTLKDSGAITDEEYQAKRKQVLKDL